VATARAEGRSAPIAGTAPRLPLMDSPAECFDRDVVCLAGLPFDVVTLAQAVERLRAAALARKRCFVSTPNLDFAVAARRDAAFRDSVLRSDLSLADGAPLVWMARLLGLPIRERVAGASVFDALRAHRGEPLKVFFFGGPPGAAQAACRELESRPGGLRAVGFDPAGFGSIDEMSGDERIARINAAGADFVIVSLGAKKGQAWIERNASRLQAPLLCHMGAVVNFVAGTVARAPMGMQRLGLEWLWRIKEEPRLWRRYWSDGVVFIGWLVARVLPAVWSARRRPACTSAQSCVVEAAASGSLRIVLSGRWCRADLAPLRAALAGAVQRGECLELNVGAVGDIDAAFLGLACIAQGALGAQNLAITGATQALRRAVRHFGAEFLLDGSP
jgi:N-acetylglucosaminyldiphosphoundecaprenol N-acetyl-beta-D-mannosaminyltransferase